MSIKVKQVKLAQALRGEKSNIIDDTKYDLEFDKGMLFVDLKYNPTNIGPFIIFPANMAYLEHYKEESQVQLQESASEVVAKRPGRPAKQ